MADQNYKTKSLIISFKSLKGEKSPNHIPYVIKVEDDSSIKESVISSLLGEKEYFDVPELTAADDDSLTSKATGPLEAPNNLNPTKSGKVIQENDFNNQDNADEEEWYKVRIVIHSHKDFSVGQVSFAEDVASFAQEFFPDPIKEKQSDENNNKEDKGRKEKEEKRYLPIIHITLDDSYVDNLYDIGKLPAHISRSYQILDSSIWNKIVPFDEHEFDNIKVGGAHGLYSAIKEIENNYRQGLYYLEVAHEYANLNARLSKQAFLSGSHASGVSPFIFHSESAIGQLINKELNQTQDGSQSITEKIENHKWRILLVDDKARQGLTSRKVIKQEGKDDELPWNCKLTIIENVLKSHLSDSSFIISHKIDAFKIKNQNEEKESCGILINYAENLKDAEGLLSNKEYDIILLDYLLESQNGNEYGYELLEDVYKNIDKAKNNQEIDFSEVKYKVGPQHRFFFIFISAYSSAVYERLLAEGLNRSEQYWHLAVGACPTNTPKLFLYNLLNLMYKRLHDSGIERLSAKGIYDVINKIYGDSDGADKIRARANKYYQDVLDMHYLYKKMLNDVQIPSGNKDSIFDTNGSVLITNFIKKNVNLGGLLEHMTQLVHLTAFGTVRQGEELWEEYIYFKAQFNLPSFIEIETGNDNNMTEEEKEEIKKNAKLKFHKLCLAIEDYIMTIKKM